MAGDDWSREEIEATRSSHCLLSVAILLALARWSFRHALGGRQVWKAISSNADSLTR